MRHKTGYGYTPPTPRLTDRHGRNSIDDFPLVPETPINIHVHALASNHWEHPNNATESEPPPQPNPAQARPNIPIVAREICIPLYPPEAIETGETEPDFEAEAEALLARLHATAEFVAPARAARRPPSAKKRSKKARARKSKSLAPRPSSLAPSSPRDHHERHCSICNHPDRDAIEEEFVHWHSVYDIAHDYQIEARALYRHAHATGLFDRRAVNVRFALGLIIQRASRVPATADSVIRAVHAFTRINREGQWVEPPSHVIVSSGSRTPSATAIAVAVAPPPTPSPEPPALPAATRSSTPPAEPNLLDTTCRLETDATR